jgi:predicted metal-dependent hydrolase
MLPAFSIRRSARARRSRLTITDDGLPVVVLPARAPERVATELVDRHARWISRHVARIRAQQAARAARAPLDAGRDVPVAGVPHRVVLTTSLHRRRSDVRVESAHLVVERSPTDRRSTAALLEAWLRARARDAIGETLGRRAVEMGLEVHQMSIRDQRTRWGSASRRGTLSFNWRLVMCPPEILDYVVVHELAHLRYAGHGPRFWSLVARHYPDSAAARRWLRGNHDALRHALD